MKYLIFHNEDFILFCFLKDFFSVLNEDPKKFKIPFFSDYIYIYIYIYNYLINHAIFHIVIN